MKLGGFLCKNGRLTKVSIRGGLNMRRKAISIWLASILVAAVFTVILIGSVNAISNDHNLSGIIWQSDGSVPTNPPTDETDFCIWVNHWDGLQFRWFRFPSVGWAKTNTSDDGLWWYSYVLPYGQKGTTWADGDLYKIEVDGTPWGEFFGNTTSNGTGSLGDPFPEPYDPGNPSNMENTLNFSDSGASSGGFFNEQQWDVRTVAPIDLVPANVTSEGRRPMDYERGLPATPGGISNICFNVTNVGTVPSGPFEIKLWNSSESYTKESAFAQIFLPSLPADGDSGMLSAQWLAPLAPGTYWIMISVDDDGAVTEFDEGNNLFLFNFTVGPDLIIDLVLANGDTIPVMGPVYVGKNFPYDLNVKVHNDGDSPTGLPGSTFRVTLYAVDGSTLAPIPGTYIHKTVDVLNASTTSDFINWNLIAPSIEGDFYLNITVDFDNDSYESKEFNNDITIWFNVPDWPVTNIEYDGRIKFGTQHWWITISTTLDFNASSSNPPEYTYYEIYDQTTDGEKKAWENYTAEGFDNFTLSYGELTYRVGYNSFDSVGSFGLFNNKTIIVDDSPPSSSLGVSVPRYRDQVTESWNITSATPLTISARDNPLGLSIIGEPNASGVSEISYRIINESDHNQVMRDWTQIPIVREIGGIFTSESFTFDTAWDDEYYRIEYLSVDNLGNAETAGASYDIIYLDNTAPVQSLTFGDPKYREDAVNDLLNISSATDITLSADDGTGSGLNRTEYRIWDPFYDTGWVTYSGAFSVPSDWRDGIYTIVYNSTDNLGNNEAESRNIYLDNNGPDSFITGQPWSLKFPNNYEITMSTLFTMSADDGMGSGVASIEYSLDMNTWYPYTIPMNFLDLFPSLPSNQIPFNHTIYVRSTDNLDTIGPTTTQLIYIEGDTAPPLPPVLRIYLNGDDIRLDWDPSESADIDHYLIYRSTSKMNFDFKSVYVDTATDSDGGVIPLRTTWNDVGAAAASAPDEYYYTIRSVDDRDNKGYTSNLVGKTTLTFENGYNTFSLPLKPFENINGSQLLESNVFTDDRDTVYKYSTNSQQWMGHGKNMPSSLDDFTLTFGEGYMIYIMEENAKVAFTGAAGTSIRFTEGVGDKENFQNSLTAGVSGYQVELNWGPDTDATGYAIYRGITRLGENSLNDFNLSSLHTITGPTTTWIDTTATGNEYYYLVVAMDGTKEGASTYSVGVKKTTLSQGYSLVSLELAPKTPTGTGRFSSEMFSGDSGTLFYYDKAIGEWRGHPRILPENINNGEINTGLAYIVYTEAEDVSYAYTGI
jgi:hypothetical protein